MDPQRSAVGKRARVRLALLSQLAFLGLAACPGGEGGLDGGTCEEAACPPNQRCEEGVCVAVSALSCPGPEHPSTGAPNLLDNPGFECELEGTWRTAFSVISRETSGARSGGGSLLLRPAEGTPSASFLPSAWSLTEIQVEQGGLYCAEIWMRGEVAHGARIGVRKTEATGAVSEDSLLGLPERDDVWERMPSVTYSRGALEARAKAGDKLQLRVYFPKPEASDHLRLDDAMLRFSPEGDCRR